MFTMITDSCADLNPRFVEKQEDFLVIPLSFQIGGKTYEDKEDNGKPLKELYDDLRAGQVSTTSQINANDLYETVLPYAKAGTPVLYITFSSGLSGTYQSAVLARQMVLEQVPEAEMHVVDSLSASGGQGLLVTLALQKRAEGMTAAQTAAWVEENRLNLVHWFTVDDLNFLKRGGRCSPAAAFFGSMLSIKPVLHVDNEGRLIAREKTRGRKAALKGLVDHMEELAIDPASQLVYLNHADCLEDAQYVAQMVHDRLGVPMDRIVIYFIGPTIGSHAGPGTVALFFVGKDRG